MFKCLKNSVSGMDAIGVKRFGSGVEWPVQLLMGISHIHMDCHI